MTRNFPTILMGLLLTSCSAKPEPARLATAQLSPAELSNIQDSIRKGMLYPESVRFEAMNSGRYADGNVVVCGWIDAKNVGGEPFYGVMTAAEGTPVFNSQVFASDPSSVAQADQMCRRAGVALPAH